MVSLVQKKNRKTTHFRGRLRRGQFETLEHRLVLDSTVVFSEIMYNPPGEDDAQLEWIELYNQLTVNMDISEWVLDGGVQYTFPDKTVVPGRGHIVIAADPAAFEAATGVAGAQGPWTGQLSNRGEELLLYNNDQRLMNSVDYRDGGDWPVAPDGGGVSLTKFAVRGASELVENWTFSPEIGGTPGRANFIEPGSFLTTDILGESSPVRAIVPLDGNTGNWTELGFDDSSWTSGTTGVGFDTRDDYNRFIGLDLDEPPQGQPAIPIQNVNQSVYIRVPFTLESDIASFDVLRLRMRYEDGFVAFLNGTEIAHSNAPGRDGDRAPLTWFSGATKSNSDRNAVQWQDFNITDFRDAFRQGENVLAIHGLNKSVSDNDLLFLPVIVGATEVKPEAGLALAINEVAAADSAEFFVEITNTGSESVDLNGLLLESGANQYTFPSQTLDPGAMLSVNSQTLGFTPADGDLLLLRAPVQEKVIDGRRVTGRLRGRSDQHDGQWLYPASPTPGAANSFQFNENVVINEIMYHPAPTQLYVAPKAPTYERTSVLALDESDWRFRQSADPLPADWASTAHAVDGSKWQSGQGLIGFSPDFDLNTQVNFPALNVPPFLTYYFEHDFEFAGSDTPFEFEMSHLIHGGAVFYLNGIEFLRFNMPEGDIAHDTPAATTLRTRRVVLSDRTAVPSELVVEGTNRLSVEVHRPGLQAIDIVFGAQLELKTEVEPGSPAQPYIESNEEWIELYNKGNEAVDLTGWQIRDGIRYNFDNGTVIEPGEYLVVANDAGALSLKYPDINIVGNFGGSLGDRDDRILLLDAHENPADDVHYYDSGRWDEIADGGASSLELSNPHADNSKGEVWSASDESGKSEWITHTISAESMNDVVNVRSGARYHEFIFGLLDTGQFLIDDISVVHNPGGDATELLQNGTFEGDTVGEAPEKWRIIGNHYGTVIVDPGNPNNKVLHVDAHGAQAHVHDHAETTFADEVEIIDGEIYEISFRAKWIEGNSRLNSRLYFNRIPSTVNLHVPDKTGTPGAQNTNFQANVGPTFSGFGHSPATPLPSEVVTVSVQAADPDGVDAVKLWWREDGGTWSTVDMADTSGTFQASIPGIADEGTIVQFYVEATDGQGVTSTFPALGPDSRALYQIEDGVGPRTPIDRYRIVMMDAEDDVFFTRTERMSNRYYPATVLHNNDVYYDVLVRQVGSRWIRPNSGYKVRFNPDQPLYGVHESVRFDLNGLIEVIMKQQLNRAGLSKASAYDDVGFLVTNMRGHSHEILVNLARYENLYLDEQFVNGSQGTKYELDDVTYPILTGRGDVERLKNETEVNTGADIGVSTRIVGEQGDNPEFYRAHVLIKSNRTQDDFESIVRMAQAIHQTDDDLLFSATNEVMDVDLWMRHYAHQAYLGNWDTYGFGRPKNLRMYTRPEDGKIVPFFWDCDLCNLTEPILRRSEGTSRLDEIRDIPHNLRLYWGHMKQMIDVSFNEDYAAVWVPHYGELLANNSHGGQRSFTDYVRQSRIRSESVLDDIEQAIPKVEFEITANDGADFEVNDNMTTLTGKGWIDVRQIRLEGMNRALDVFWPETDTWRIELPLGMGANLIKLEAIGFDGNVFATDSITINSTVANPVSDALRITEVNYNPADPTATELGVTSTLNNDDFEFVEFQNVGNTTINLLNSRIADGVEYTFPATLLAPGDYGVVVKNIDAFQLRYGTDVNVIGQFTDGSLNNNGETVRLVDGTDQVILEFTYGDGGDWPSQADGLGATLQLIDASTTAANRYDKASSWRGSTEFGGSPGSTGAERVGVVINEVLTNTDAIPDLSDSIELHNTTGAPMDIGGWYLSDSQNNLLKYQIASGTSIPSGGYMVFNEQHFNPTPDNSSDSHFGLSGANGDDVWLVLANEDGQVETFVDDVHFGAAASGESFGRVDGLANLAPMSSVTLGAANSAPRVGPVVISEVNYNPGVPSDAAKAQDAGITSGDLEFVEVTNPTASAVDLTGWRIRGGVDYDFNGSQLGPGQSVVVLSFNPESESNASRLAAFKTHYGVSDSVRLIGGYQGQLSNLGERVELQRPGTPPEDDPGAIPNLLEDQVIYDTVSPWPDADGSGKSLTRTSETGWGSASSSWAAADPNLGTTNFSAVTLPGDANRDGTFNQLDLVKVLQAGKFMTGQPATFEEGDWTGDGLFNQLDLVAALQAGGFQPGGAAAKAEVDAVDALFADFG